MEDILQVLGDMIGRRPLSFQELLEPVQLRHQEAPAPHSYGSFLANPQKILSTFCLEVDSIEKFDQHVLPIDGNKYESMNCCAGNGEFPNDQSGENGSVERSIEKTEQVWQRVRWTNEMVKLLITAVSYAGEEVSSDCPESERSQSLAPIKGKWRAISNAMVERGSIVSPQQCEDKFNDLNRKYKRLNNVLATGTSCDVVGNPALVDSMNIPAEAKQEVRKILACKQLFYPEMWSCHNKNRKFLPHDATLQQSVRSTAVKGKTKCESCDIILGTNAKKRKHGEDDGFSSWADASAPQKVITDVINAPPEAIEEQPEPSQWISHSRQLEEKKLQIQKQMLDLEKEKLEWLKFCQQENRELQKMKLENELMKLGNKRLALKLKCQERGKAQD